MLHLPSGMPCVVWQECGGGVWWQCHLQCKVSAVTLYADYDKIGSMLGLPPWCKGTFHREVGRLCDRVSRVVL